MREDEIAERLAALEAKVSDIYRRINEPELQTGDGFGGGFSDEPPAEVVALLQQNRKIEAVKLYRGLTGMGLAEAHAAVEEIDRTYRPSA